MKFLVDMNLSPRWAELLVGAGWQSRHWSHLGKFNATDAEIIKFATDGDWVVLTHDLDFGAILAASGEAKPSVVQLRAIDVSLDAIGTRVVAALRRAQSELEAGALLTIDANRLRIRVLPFGPTAP